MLLMDIIPSITPDYSPKLKTPMIKSFISAGGDGILFNIKSESFSIALNMSLSSIVLIHSSRFVGFRAIMSLRPVFHAVFYHCVLSDLLVCVRLANPPLLHAAIHTLTLFQ